jgi:ABC-2 type transport system ATP-binding protein
MSRFKSLSMRIRSISKKLRFWKRREQTEYPLEVRKLYGGPKGLVKNVSFRVRKRDTFAIVGPSGSGKTSMMKVIFGLFKKTSGDVKSYGKPVNKMKKRMAFCPQQHSFFKELSVRENVILFGSLNGLSEQESVSRGTTYLKELEMDGKMDQLAAFLSGGEGTRLNIILSVLHRPLLIFFDEPFTGLDYYNRNLLWAFIKKRKREGSTIILTTHLLTEAQKNCNRMMVIKDGKKFVIGDVEDIREKVNLDYVYEVKFKNMSKKRQKQVERYCTIHDIDILSLQVDVFWFGIKESKKKRLESLLKRFEHRTLSIREPEINDLFLKVAET